MYKVYSKHYYIYWEYVIIFCLKFVITIKERIALCLTQVGYGFSLNKPSRRKNVSGMGYSIISTKKTFSPESSILLQII